MGYWLNVLKWGFSGGVSIYNGDLSPSITKNILADGSASYGLLARMNFQGTHAVRLNFLRTTLHADDRFGDNNLTRQLDFRSSITELTIIGEINPIQVITGNNPKIYPYLFAGIGGFHFNPLGKIDDRYVQLQPLGTEGQGIEGNPDRYATTELVVPLGIGVKVHINRRTTLEGELGYRLLFTDYLDDVSDTEVDYLQVLENNGPLAARFSNPNLDPSDPLPVKYTRGGNKRDGYFIASLTLAFRFGGGQMAGNSFEQNLNARVNCPKFR